MKKIIILSSILFLSLFSTSYVFAAESANPQNVYAPQHTTYAPTDDSSFKHFYAGINLVPYTHKLPRGTALKYVNGNCDSYTDSCMDTDLGFQVNVGYQFSQYFALQADYVYLANESNSDDLTVNGVNYSLPDSLNINAVDLMGKGILPLGAGFKLYGEAGAAYVWEKDYNKILPNTIAIDSSNGRFTPAVGAGLSYYPIKWLSIDAGVKYYAKNGPINSITMFPVGVAFHFA